MLPEPKHQDGLMSLDDAAGYGTAAMGLFTLPGQRRAPPPIAGNPEPVAAHLAGMDALLDPTGALYWPVHKTLIVSDLHLETGSSYARTGQMLPPYDTGVTLSRLADAVERFAPDRIVSLGDSFHDPYGFERLCEADGGLLGQLIDGVEWVWIAGNHDHESAQALGGVATEVFSLGGVSFRHIPTDGALDQPEVAGHLHPAARLVIRGKPLKRRCFVGCAMRLIMPAFGCLTRGLPLSDPAFSALWPVPPAPRAHLISRDRVYSV